MFTVPKKVIDIKIIFQIQSMKFLKTGKLVKLKWLDDEDKILETVDCVKTKCN